MNKEDTVNVMGVEKATEIRQCDYGWAEVQASPSLGLPLYRGCRSGFWFFHDGVCSPKGGWLIPDDAGIVEWDGSRFQIKGLDCESRESSVSGVPVMEPHRPYQDLVFEGADGPFSGKGHSDREVVKALLQAIYAALSHSLGNGDAGRVLGAILSYCAAPEIVERYKCFPGLWLWGPSGGGKTSLVHWLMSIWGFRDLAVSSAGRMFTSAAAMEVTQSQFSNLPCVLDDVRDQDLGPAELAVLHCAYNRGERMKWAKGGLGHRVARTNWIVCGEKPCGFRSTRGRFAHAWVMPRNRGTDNLEWWQETSPLFSFVGRIFIENREWFAKCALHGLDGWMDQKSTQIPNERVRLAAGVGYACMLTAMQIVGLTEPSLEEEIGEAALLSAEMEGVLND